MHHANDTTALLDHLPSPARATLAVWIMLSAPLVSQGVWTPYVDVGARSGHEMAYDEHRQRAILFGGHGTPGTWEWDGTIWSRMSLAGPTERVYHQMVYEPLTQRTILLGGIDPQSGAILHDMWSWDGTAWMQLPTTIPPSRAYFQAVHDPAQGRILLVGGGRPESGGWLRLNEIWAYSGGSWSQIDITRTGLPDVSRAKMAFDRARQRLVIMTTEGTSWQVWESAGTAWVRSPLTPPFTTGIRLVYDAGIGRTVVLVGADLWGWDGLAWVRLNSPPYGARETVATYDYARQCLVVHGGSERRGRNTVVNSDTWLLVQGAWRLGAQRSPTGAEGARMVFDPHRGRCILFGGFGSGETWEWDGSVWLKRNVSGPSARGGHAMAYDSHRRRVVLHGGSPDYDGNAGILNDTWEYDGTYWSFMGQHASVESSYDGMAYDEGRGRTLLVASQLRADRGLWSWDGAAWTHIGPGPGTQTSTSSAAYDSTRNLLVVFGENLGIREWDGTAWQSRYPTALAYASTTYDTARQRVQTLFGSRIGQSTASQDFTEWDGEVRFALLNSLPPERSSAAVAYDSQRRRTVVFGGESGLGRIMGDTWEWQPSALSSVTLLTGGCPGSTGVPSLRVSAPVIGSRRFGLTITGLPAFALTFLGISGTTASQTFGSCIVHPSLPFASTLISLAGANGTTPFPLPIPNDQSLAGVRLTVQAGALDPGASLLGIASLSDSAQITIGG